MLKKAGYTLIIISLIFLVFFSVNKCARLLMNDSKNGSTRKAVLTQQCEVKVERHDTIIYRDKIIVVEHNTPTPIYINDSVHYYSDHIQNTDLDITIKDSIKGTLLRRTYEYKPIVKIEQIEITKTVPQIIEVTTPEEQHYKLIIGAIATLQNSSTVMFGGEIGFLNKKNIGLSYQYQTDLTNKFHSLKITKTLNF